VLAIIALLGAKFFALNWMDPVMGIVGALLVSRWSWILLRQTSAVLLDQQAPEAVRCKVREAIESVHDNRVTDLHVWAIGPGLYAAIISVVTHEPQPVEFYRKLVPPGLGMVHVTVEVQRCA